MSIAQLVNSQLQVVIVSIVSFVSVDGKHKHFVCALMTSQLFGVPRKLVMFGRSTILPQQLTTDKLLSVVDGRVLFYLARHSFHLGRQLDTTTRSFYSVLGLKSNASQKEIRAAYLELCKKYHPDKFGDSKESNLQFQKINEAYNCLSKTSSRRQYDQSSWTRQQSASHAQQQHYQQQTHYSYYNERDPFCRPHGFHYGSREPNFRDFYREHQRYRAQWSEGDRKRVKVSSTFVVFTIFTVILVTILEVGTLAICTFQHCLMSIKFNSI